MSNRFNCHTLPLPGLVLLERIPRVDERGYLERLFDPTLPPACGFDGAVRQINHTLTRLRGTVRGLHFQRPPVADAKLVTCIRGKVFDVAVDIRKGSPTFLRWHSEILDAGGFRSMFLPAGFAHGFQTLTEDCELLYLHFADHHPEHEGGIPPEDPEIGIQWPEAISVRSDRDAAHAPVSMQFQGEGL